MASLFTTHRWCIAPNNPELEERLASALGVAPLVARIMVAHGIGGVEEGRLFLAPSLERDWADPRIIPGMAEVAARVERAGRDDEVIAVFGDFDVDGITSTCLLTEALRQLGACVHPFIPHRFEEGYGLTAQALDRVVEACEPSLVITVDNGIAARDEVVALAGRGIDIVVPDHHEPSDLVPVGIPVTDPKMVDESPSRELAGAGVALKLVQILGERLGQPQLWRSYTEVAALGTVSDMMCLTPENRALVADGIAHMRATARPGYIALAAVTRTDLSTITADALSFSLIPRLNAAGRMADPTLALDLLLARDAVEAGRLAAALEEINQQRRAIEAELTGQAEELAERTYDGGRAIVVGGEGWHEGVKGIVARRDRLIAVLADLPAEDFEARGEIAATVGLDELDIETIRQIGMLEPFGQGNRVPLLASRGVTMCDRAVVGKTGDHMRCIATDGAASVPAIMFRAPEVEQLVNCDTVVDLVFEAVAECWQGRVKPKLMVKDILCRSCEEPVSADEALVRVGERAGEGDRASKPACARPCATSVDADRRAALARLPYEQLTRSLIHTFIGPAEPHRAQMDALDALKERRGVLAVMGTGRGKSLIFHVHAVREAILNGSASIFVYPLRALVTDQAYHLQETLASLGVRVGVLTGDTPTAARDRAFSLLGVGKLDIVLTTPEFLSIHLARFAASRRIGFVVVDEAHHVAGAKGGDRTAYLDMPQILHDLLDPTVLAVTATASAEVAAEIRRLLPVDAQVVDAAVRENLELDDGRDLSSRENRLVSIVATGQKSVVYVNSRDQAQALCRTLRRRVPELGARIAFYHAGLTRPERASVEAAFRDGELACIVSTSAFGEGVNIPDIRHVVLYHMPFGDIEFNQMSGRAGRDGAPASIHLLYSGRDARSNERLLDAAAPDRRELVTLYRALQTMWRRHRGGAPTGPLPASDLDIAQMCVAVDARTPVDERAVPSGLAIFEELGFARVTGDDDARAIEMVENPGHVDLNRSILYLEGLHARREFSAFRDWALSASAHDMLTRINRPITPQVHEGGAVNG